MKLQTRMALAAASALACTAGSAAVASASTDTRHSVDPFAGKKLGGTKIEGLAEAQQGGITGDTKYDGQQQAQGVVQQVDGVAINKAADVTTIANTEAQQVGPVRQVGE